MGKISECCPFLPFPRFGKHWQKGQKTSKRMTQIVPSMRWCYTWPQQNMPRGLSWGSHKDQLELLQKHLKQLSIIGFPKHMYFFSEVNLAHVHLQPAADVGQCCFNFFFPIRPMKFPQIWRHSTDGQVTWLWDIKKWTCVSLWVWWFGGSIWIQNGLARFLALGISASL